MWRRAIGFGLLAFLATGLVGCKADEAPVEGYESADPGRSSQSWDEEGVIEDSDPLGASPADIEPTLREADIVQIEGDRLYALSRYQDFSIIDIGQRDTLSVLGRFQIQQAQPFEMYLRGDVVLAMFTKVRKEVVDEKNGFRDWAHTNLVVALEFADPKAIRELGRFEIRGELSDSRVVGAPNKARKQSPNPRFRSSTSPMRAGV